MPWHACAVAARTALLLAPGYIHPDEFFQAQEVAAIRRHALNETLPWEFASVQPCRSAVLPLTAAELPYGEPATTDMCTISQLVR
jgi:phosphatidylinositol glycan class Z